VGVVMGANINLDFKGRLVTHAPHYSNCLIFALQQPGRTRMRMIGWVPHFYVETEQGTHEFVYGEHGRNGLFPLLFLGYGVAS
jgi:hypothetical protein